MIRLIDRAFPFIIALTALACVSALLMIFFYAPVELQMGIVQKIFYVHVPSAMAAYAGFTIASLCSLLYLVKPHEVWDLAARSGAEVGLLFCLYVMISGPLWAYKAWGAAWVWDPQLTATFILFLLYGGYVLLRSLSRDNPAIRKIAAVLAVIAFVDIPIIHYAVRKWGGIHPEVERGEGGGLAPAMKHTFSLSMLAFLLLFFCLLWLVLRVRLMSRAVDRLHLDLEDLAHDHT